jgi:hypothetical protein
MTDEECISSHHVARIKSMEREAATVFGANGKLTADRYVCEEARVLPVDTAHGLVDVCLRLRHSRCFPIPWVQDRGKLFFKVQCTIPPQHSIHICDESP